VKAGRIGAELGAERRQRTQIREQPWLGRVCQIAVRQQNDGRHVAACQANGLERHLKAIRRGGRGDHRQWRIRVAAVHRLKEISLVGFGWHAG
jgi:hypothetical protein